MPPKWLNKKSGMITTFIFVNLSWKLSPDQSIYLLYLIKTLLLFVVRYPPELSTGRDTAKRILLDEESFKKIYLSPFIG